MSVVKEALRPRKSPVQSRSTATIDALQAAAIQVLARYGLSGTTTTRIAERAGTSIGSLYQYYPNRDALIAAVLERHLNAMADAIDEACRQQKGMRVAEMASSLVSAFLAVKLSDPVQAKALYAVASERGGPELVARVYSRTVEAIASMIASASDASFADPSLSAAIAFDAMAGPVRSVLEGYTANGVQDSLHLHLVRLVTAYLQTFRV
ncbi:TetR/AcrR family transcriptional regulator [Rhizobium sp. S95]|uniref:TetR/AcrR family transcriptional regulator n=1 Tax=Ciceribacter sichuanensis TaxID=2949647 RepID=A0AAJ1F8U0_9HYPH|nr:MULTISPECIES: TetR/AcrR family transcriptional regulator [unclassified Ciceribacter]MCM2397847.1 TetR/AcrR family transcriptional regulator [Ciceribacter sp. S95]MCO5959347.1 TetR/AcrR family transcriptional regulator [Ciceribacter sp. S101]